MDLKPKANPGSPPNILAETTIPELFSFLRSDVDRVEKGLVAEYAKLRAEIGPLQEKVELERLMKLQAQDELSKKEELCQKGNIAQQSYEKLLRETNKRKLRDKSIIEELVDKNRELERENLKLKEKWADDRKAISELRIRVAELEDENKKNVETIGKLRTENCKFVHLDLGNVYGSFDGNSKRKPQTPLQRIKEIRQSGHVRGEAALDRGPLLVYRRRNKGKGRVDLGV